MEFHPVAAIFPLMPAEERKALAADILANGLREEIWTFDGKIIDGRNRFLACRDAGVEPRFREWDGVGSLVSFVVSLNLTRRHLTESQRAMVAAKLANVDSAGRPKEIASIEAIISQTDAAKMLNVSRSNVQRAAKVQKEGVRELADKVESGQMPVSAAAVIAEMPKSRQRSMLKKGRKALRKLMNKARTDSLRTVETGLVTCLHCSPVAKFDLKTVSAFCQRLQFRAEAYAKQYGVVNLGPLFNAVILECEESEIAAAAKDAADKILDAIDRGTVDGEAGLVEKVDAMHITKLGREEFDAAITYLLDYSLIEVVKMQGKQDTARGARKDLLRRKIVERPETTVELDPDYDPDFQEKDVYLERW